MAFRPPSPPSRPHIHSLLFCQRIWPIDLFSCCSTEPVAEAGEGGGGGGRGGGGGAAPVAVPPLVAGNPAALAPDAVGNTGGNPTGAARRASAEGGGVGGLGVPRVADGVSTFGLADGGRGGPAGVAGGGGGFGVMAGGAGFAGLLGGGGGGGGETGGALPAGMVLRAVVVVRIQVLPTVGGRLLF